jgi:hypothetical protein
MASDAQKTEVKITGDSTQVELAMRKASTAVQSGVDRMTSSLSLLVAGALTSVVGMTTALVKKLIDVDDAMSKSAQKAGVSTEKFSGMAFAAKLANVGVEELTKTYGHLSKMLLDGQQGQKDAVELFKQLKVDPKNIKDADELLLTLSDRISRMQDPTAKTALAIDVLGERIGPKLIPLLNAGRAGIEELRAEASRLGIVVDTETGKAAEEFNDTMTRMKDNFTGVAQRLTKVLLPTFQAAATEVNNLTKTSGGMEIFGDIVRVVFQTIAVVGANVSFVLQAVGREIGAVIAQVAALARLDLEGFHAISEAVKEDGKKARAELDAFEARIMALGKVSSTGGGTEPDATGNDKPFVPGKKTPTPTKAAPEKSRMGDWETALAERKVAYQQENDLREMSKADELAYWRSISQMVDLNGKERVSLRRKVAGAELDVMKEQRDREVGLTEESISATQQARMAGVEAMRQELQHKVDLGLATNEEMLASERGLEDQRAQILRDAIQQRLQLLSTDPTKNAVALQKLNDELAAIELEHQQRLRANLNQSQVEQMKDWQGLFNSIGQSFGSVVTGLVSRTMTLGQAVRSLFSSLLQSVASFLGQMVAKKAAAWATEQAIDSAKIGSNAAVAGSGAASAMASIPWVGPVLAIAAMAAVFAAVMGMKGKSAAGGYDIPSGVNPMTQLHQEEMVLPKPLANVIRAMAKGGGSGQGQQFGDVHMTVVTPDANSFRESQDRITGDLHMRINEIRRGV